MKVAVLSESSADEAAIRILVDVLLGAASERVDLFQLRSRGWPSVRNVLPTVIKHAYFWTDAEGLVVVADANGSVMHREVESGTACEEGCRCCHLRRIAAAALGQVRGREGRAGLRVAIGLAAPAIEAWLLCGKEGEASEAAWGRILAAGSGRITGRRAELKRALYGTDRPSLAVETEVMVREARRVAGDLLGLERAFPAGFGGMAREVRGWPG